MSPDNFPYPVTDTRYAQATSAGAKWTRWPMYWHHIERTQGQYDYSAQDQVVNADVARGLNINAILMGTPPWAGAAVAGTRYPFDITRKGDLEPLTTIQSGAPAASVPPGLDLPVFVGGQINPENHWAKFVETTVRRYAGRVKVWELWNEPDLRANGQGVFWLGSPQQYARLLTVGYQAAKYADPSATVLFAGLAYWSDQSFFPQALEALAASPEARANNYAFDAIPWHPYISANNLIDFVQRARTQMAARSINKPIWVNETNIPVCDDKSVDPNLNCPALYRGTMDEQASYVVQTAALSAGLGVQKLLFFQLYDDSVGPSEWYGFVRNNGLPRPALAAFSAVSRYLGRYRSATWRRLGAYDLVQLGGVPDGGSTARVSVVWSRGGATTARVRAAGSSARLYNQTGGAADGLLRREGADWAVNLPGVTNTDMALGAPYFLVEPVGNDTAAPSISLSVPADSCTPAPVSWSATDDGWGVWNYDVDVRTGGDWTRWKDATVDSSGSYTAPADVPVSFRARARDLAGNESGWTERTITPRGCGTNAITNGGFDQGLSGWATGGSGPVVTGSGANGAGAILGSDLRLEPGQSFGNSTLRQLVTVPGGRPALGFNYRIDGAGCPAGWFEVILNAGPNQSTRVEYPVAPRTLRQPSGWTYVSYDFTPYAGQTVDLIFNVVNVQGSQPLAAGIDDVRLASVSGASLSSLASVPQFALFLPVAGGLRLGC